MKLSKGIIVTYLLIISSYAYIHSALSKKIIFWGMDYVLFKPDVNALPGGWIGALVGYTPREIENELFNHIRAIPYPQMNGRQSTGPYSPIFCHWLVTPNSSAFIREQATTYISNTCWLLKKIRLKLAAEYAFTPEKMAIILKPNQDLIPIIHGLKKRGHRLVIASNWNMECFQGLVKKYRSFMPLFESAYISGKLGYLTFEQPFFATVFRELQARPQDCILIDSRHESLMAAQKAGIKIITYSTGQQVGQALKKLKVL